MRFSQQPGPSIVRCGPIVRILLIAWLQCPATLVLAEPVRTTSTYVDRTQGMLLGSLIGDAMGGPVEFKSQRELNTVLPDLRNADAQDFKAVLREPTKLQGFRCLPYAKLRPNIAPYGPWEKKAAAGTVTDDSRHKMILLHCLRQATGQQADSLSAPDLARAYLEYFDQPRWSLAYRNLATDSFREYRQAARWLQGERDTTAALPPSRIWAGIANCSGQMAFLPLAAVYPGDPDGAYRATFALGFIDTGQAKDINCAMVASLAAAIGSQETDVHQRWKEAIEAIRSTDPYRYADVPFAKRPAVEWLDFALKSADDAQDSPAKLYQTLEQHGRPKYFWDAHFTFATTWAFLHFANYDPDTAILLSLAFGHDTDSTAQLIGALCGAIHGTHIFPSETKGQVEERLEADYGESIHEWTEVLRRLRDRDKPPGPVSFVEVERIHAPRDLDQSAP